MDDTTDLPLPPAPTSPALDEQTLDIGPCDLLLDDETCKEVPNEAYLTLITQRDEWYKHNI